MNEKGMVGACVVPHPPLILPEVGHGEEARIQHTIDAYRAAARFVAELRPDVVVITSPHAVMYADYFHFSLGEKAAGDFGAFGAPKLRLAAAYDTAFVRHLEHLAAAEDFPAGTFGEKSPELDHGTMIPLRFLQEVGYAGPIVRVGLSGLSRGAHYHLGQLIAQTAEALGRRVCFVASGDLSHKLKKDGPYGLAPEGAVFDAQMQRDFSSGEFLSLLMTPYTLAEKAAECGLRSFWIMTGALDRHAVQSELLSYEGPFGVGYAVATFAVTGTDEKRNFGEQAERMEREALAVRREREDGYVKLARLSLETFVKTHGYAKLPEGLPAALTERAAGAFVSLKKDGQLRGCIGTILPTKRTLAEEILANAVAAGTRDPRFSLVTADELPQLVYDVDVLSRPEPVDSAASLDAKKYGVIVESGEKRGLLLPDLDGINTVEQQIDIARRKGNIARNEKIQLYRFTVTRHI